METLEELEEISDIISLGADYSHEDNELLLYVSSPEMSVSLHLKTGEWDQFVKKIKSIDSQIAS